MKKGYIVAEVRVINPTAYAEYQAQATAIVAQYGGQFIVRGGNREQREGADAEHNDEWRTMIIEFPSLEQARVWYDSPEFTEAKKTRLANTISRLFIVEGV